MNFFVMNKIYLLLGHHNGWRRLETKFQADTQIFEVVSKSAHLVQTCSKIATMDRHTLIAAVLMLLRYSAQNKRKDY